MADSTQQPPQNDLSSSFRSTNLTPLSVKKQPQDKKLPVISPTQMDGGDGFYHCYGVTPGSDSKPHSHCMPRVLEVTCTLLEVMSPRLHNKNLFVTVYLKNEFRRKVLKSPIMQITKTNTSVTNVELPINTVFHLQYMHHIKKRIDVLEISIKANKIKKKRDSMSDIGELQSSDKASQDAFKTIGTVAINLAYVLQCPIDDILQFKHVSGDNEVVFDLLTPFTNANETTDLVAKMRVKIATQPLSQDFIRTLLERKPKKKKYLGISFGKQKQSNLQTPKKSPQNKKDDSDVEYDDVSTNSSDGGSLPPNTPSIDAPKIQTTAPNGDKRFNNLRMGIIKGLNYLKKKKVEQSPDDENDLISPRQIKKGSTKRESMNAFPVLELVSTIHEQLDYVFKNKKLRDVIFVNLRTRRGKKFGDFLKRDDGPLRFVLCTTGIEDIQASMVRIAQVMKTQGSIAEDTKIRIMTVGSDSYTNEILRTALQHFSQTPKQWEHFIFYPIPMTSSRYNTNKDTSTGFVVNFAGKHSNALCDYIASKNQRYNEIFSATTNPHDWIEHMDTMMEELERNMIQFFKEGNEVLKLTISQALLTVDNTTERPSSGDKQPESAGSVISPSVSNLSSNSLNNAAEQEGSQIILPFVNTVQIFNDVLSTVGSERAVSKDKKNILKRVQNALQGSKDFQEEMVLSDNEDNASVNMSTVPSTTPTPLTIHTESNGLSTLNVTANTIISPATENEELMVEKKNTELATNLSNSDNAVEMKVDYWLSTNKMSFKHNFKHITVFKLPNANIPEEYVPTNNQFTLCTLKSKKKEEQHHYEKNITRVICKVEKKKQSACVVVDGVEWNNIKFVSLSQQMYSKGFNFVVAVFADKVTKMQSVDSTGSMRHLLDDLDVY